MRITIAFSALLIFLQTARAADFAYESDAETDVDGKVTRTHTLSDGNRTVSTWTDTDGTARGMFRDQALRLAWAWPMSNGCSQITLPPKGLPPRSPHLYEKEIGQEMIAGHPTRKFSYRVEYSFGGKAQSDSRIEWRATDLHDFVLRSETQGKASMRVRKITLRTPQPEELAFAATPCKYDPVNDDSGYAAQAQGGFRQVRFFDLGCKKIVPLGVVASIPSNYEIRIASRFGCIAGIAEDLDRLLAQPDVLDFEAIKHGVLWTRIATSAEYRAPAKRFVSEYGSDDAWEQAIAAAGGSGVRIERGDLAGLASVRISARMQGKPVRMCYLGVADSPAILLSWQAPAASTPADDEQWKHVLDSLKKAPREMAAPDALTAK